MLRWFIDEAKLKKKRVKEILPMQSTTQGEGLKVTHFRATVQANLFPSEQGFRFAVICGVQDLGE